MRALRRIAAIAALCAIAGCADWPEPAIPGAEAARAAPWPTLVPLNDIFAAAPTSTEPVVAPASRIAALRARAASLRGPVIDGATRARLARGVDIRALQGAR